MFCDLHSFFWALNADAASKPQADSSFKKSGSSVGTIPGNTEPGTEEVNGGCTSSCKGTSFYSGDLLLFALRTS